MSSYKEKDPPRCSEGKNPPPKPPEKKKKDIGSICKKATSVRADECGLKDCELEKKRLERKQRDEKGCVEEFDYSQCRRGDDNPLRKEREKRKRKDENDCGFYSEEDDDCEESQAKRDAQAKAVSECLAGLPPPRDGVLKRMGEGCLVEDSESDCPDEEGDERQVKKRLAELKKSFPDLPPMPDTKSYPAGEVTYTLSGVYFDLDDEQNKDGSSRSCK